MEVGRFRTEQEGVDRCLAVLALGEACWLVPMAGGCRLLVAPAAVARVQHELALYERERVNWPPVYAPDAAAKSRLDLVTPMGWAFLVLLAYRGQVTWPWFTAAGDLDVRAVWGQGEFWRAFTALFLHGDSSHLVSNLFAGVFVFATATSIFGRGRGWLLILLAGVMGNLADAAAHYPNDFRSLGASTAIFGGVGLLTGRALAIALRPHQPHRWRTFFLPLATGLTVLGLYGAGGPQVDVLAHVTGFISGLALGSVAALRRA